MATVTDTTVPVFDPAAMQAMDLTLHLKRMQGITETAYAAGLKRLLEGTMSNDAWTTLTTALGEAEQANALNVAAVAALAGNAVDPAVLAAATKRLNAMRDASLAAVKAAGTPATPTV